MIIPDKVRESLNKLLSTRRGKLIALFIFLGFGQEIGSLIGASLPIILFLTYLFFVYRERNKIKGLPFYQKFIIALPVYGVSMIPFFNDEYFFASQFLLVPGIGFFGFKLFQFEKGRTFQNIPTSKMRSVAMGLAEVKGEVESIDDLIDPIFNNPCVYYNIEIKEYRKSGKKSRLVPIHTKEKSQSFYLSDDTGSIFIPGELIPSLKNKITEMIFNNTVKMKIDYDFGESVIFKKKLPKQIQDYFDKNNIKNKRRQTCQITIIEPGDKLYALGNARSLHESESEHKTKATAAIDLSDDNRFVISDKSEKELTEEALSFSWFKPGLAILIGAILLLTPADEIDKLIERAGIFVGSNVEKSVEYFLQQIN